MSKPVTISEAQDQLLEIASALYRIRQRLHRQHEGLKAEYGQTVHSFATLLAHLATLCRHRMRTKIKGEATFVHYTDSTPLQRRAFDLLGVPIRM